jgi:hypothetical protein
MENKSYVVNKMPVIFNIHHIVQRCPGHNSWLAVAIRVKGGWAVAASISYR